MKAADALMKIKEIIWSLDPDTDDFDKNYILEQVEEMLLQGVEDYIDSVEDDDEF